MTEDEIAGCHHQLDGHEFDEHMSTHDLLGGRTLFSITQQTAQERFCSSKLRDLGSDSAIDHL